MDPGWKKEKGMKEFEILLRELGVGRGLEKGEWLPDRGVLAMSDAIELLVVVESLASEEVTEHDLASMKEAKYPMGGREELQRKR